METQIEDHIVLRVGEETISANKETLIAASDYFKGLFSGYFVDSELKELDLTKDVENMNDLKTLLVYMNTGEVEITDTNLSQILKISSFFIVEPLTEQCAKFMETSSTITNSLKYYLYAFEYALPNFGTFKSYLEARFHDLLLYDEFVEYLSEDELSHLLTSGIMKYCAKENVFNFLLMWLSHVQSLTETHIKLVSDIIEYVNTCKTIQNIPFECSFSENVLKMDRRLVVRRNASLVQDIRKLFIDYLVCQYCTHAPNTESDVGQSVSDVSLTNHSNEDLINSQSDMSVSKLLVGTEHEEKSKLKRNTDTEAEMHRLHVQQSCMFNRRITRSMSLQRKKYVRDRKTESEVKSEAECTDVRLGECEIRIYFYETFSNDKVEDNTARPSVNTVGERDCNREKCVGLFTFSQRKCIERESCEKGHDQRTCCSMCVPPKQDVTTSDSMHVFDICVYQPDSRAWYHITTFDELKYFSEVDERPVHLTHTFKTSTASIFCNILVIENEIWFLDICSRFKLIRYNIASRNWTNKTLDRHNVTHFKFILGKNGVKYFITKISTDHNSYFRGYSAQPGSLNFVPIFVTESVHVNHGNMFNSWSLMTVNISRASNEILILDTKGTGDNLAFIIDLGSRDRGQQAKPTLMLHTTSGTNGVVDLLFVDVDILETADRFLVVSSGSNSLTTKFECIFHSETITSVDVVQKYQITQKVDHLSEKANISQFRDSYWMIDADNDMVSGCKQIKFKATGSPTIEYHTPPPFSTTIAVCATEVNKSLFSDLEPVKHFLERRRNKATDV